MSSISICICTFRRPAGLAKVLASVANLLQPTDCRLEVIVVDNDAGCSAEQAVSAAQPQYPFPLRYYCEAQSGVGHARNRCVQEAAGDWIAFIDDDEWVEPQWLMALWAMAASGRYDGVFGPVLAVFEVAPPAWLVGSGVYVRHQFPTGTLMTWRDCASGNVIFKKHLFAKVGGFSPVFAASGAEDTDFFWRCIDQGARLAWCDEAVAHENIPPVRMTRRWVWRRAYLGGHNYARLHGLRAGRVAFWKYAFRGSLVALAYVPLVLLARLRSDPKSLAYECKVVGGWGKVMALISLPETEYGPGK